MEPYLYFTVFIAGFLGGQAWLRYGLNLKDITLKVNKMKARGDGEINIENNINPKPKRPGILRFRARSLERKKNKV